MIRQLGGSQLRNHLRSKKCQYIKSQRACKRRNIKLENKIDKKIRWGLPIGIKLC